MYVQGWRPKLEREFVLTGFQLTLEAGVSSSVENESMKDSGKKTVGKSWITVMRRLLGDQEEMSCFFSEVH